MNILNKILDINNKLSKNDTKIRFADKNDLKELLKEGLRPEDKDEFNIIEEKFGNNLNAEDSLVQVFNSSETVFTYCSPKKIFALFGVKQTNQQITEQISSVINLKNNKTASPWLVGTKDFSRKKQDILYLGPKIIELFLNEFEILFNLTAFNIDNISETQKLFIKNRLLWLEKCGFVIGKAFTERSARNNKKYIFYPFITIKKEFKKCVQN
ncbi:hypothetical protein [Desulfovibrio litoralis]|uniref:Uncharacterized protein n=1 Tax=Desulfovibrio litoralis DSM 11393 TaxID=1121455 RepID=A0A1M7SWP3_9BACT|nr:hypothetical protein [Desulfovibrio litoralis]SHN62871.1 hypothetical protein SAMN02745728_01311 [Desulfovibrio litoralis DSM 11393]